MVPLLVEIRMERSLIELYLVGNIVRYLRYPHSFKALDYLWMEYYQEDHYRLL